jgi:xanthine dehydrogenase accessory factor
VKPKGDVVALRDADGAELHGSACPSGGTVDILIEPYRPAPRVAVLGATPVAAALLRLAGVTGYRTAIAAAEAERAALPAADAHAAPDDLSPLALGPEDTAVVAVQGRGDLAAAKAALLSGAGHVAMVASRRKARVLAERLRAEGVPPERIAAMESPAGVDLGAVEPEEIALSIMAGIVRARRRGRLGAAPEAESG